MINELFLELNEDFTIKSQSQDAITPYSNGKVKLKVWSKAPSTDAISVGYKLVNGIIVDEEMIFLTATNIDGNGTNQWEGFVQSHVLGGAAQDGNRDFKLRVIDNDIANPVINQEAGFTVKIGVVNVPSDLAALSPTLNESYATVLFEEDGITPNGNIWQYRDTDLDDVPITPAWLDSGLKEILQFKNAVVAEYQIEEGWEPSTAPIDPTATQNILDYLATLGGKIAALEDEQNDHVKVREDLIANYPQKSVLDGKDILFVQDDETLEGKRTTVSDLVELRENPIGIFATASGLTCPDVNDLLCAYPNNSYGAIELAAGKVPPFDPNDRLGMTATVTATNSKWSYSVSSITWLNTGELPNQADGIGYDSSSDPSTAANNVQDALNEHGNKIEDNKEDIVEIINGTTTVDKAFKDGNGDVIDTTYRKVSENTAKNTTYDNVDSTLLATDVKVAVDELDGKAEDNKGDISTLDGEVVKKTGDQLIAGKKTFTEEVVITGPLTVTGPYVEKLPETVIIEDAIIVLNANEAGTPSVDGGIEIERGTENNAQLIFDESVDKWSGGIIGAIKAFAFQDEVTLNSTHRTGDGLDHSEVQANKDAIASRELLTNKTDDVVSNFNNSDKYPSTKGTYDYVNRIDILNEADRRYSTMIQGALSADFVINSSDTTLVNGRIEYVFIDSISLVDGNARFSVDGGVTFRELAIANGVTINPAQNVIFGKYFDFIYSLAFDKWLVLRTDQDFIEVTGLDIGWTPDKTIQQNWLDNNTQDNRLDNQEVQTKPSALQKIAKTATGSLGQTGVASVKLDFDVVVEPSKEPTILDVDVNKDHLLVVKREPGASILLNVASTNTGGGLETVTSYYPVINRNIAVSIIVIGKQYRITSIGTTDFTTIGATTNTIGEVFTATGTDAGSGVVQLVLGVVAIDLEPGITKERSKTFYAFADDYVDDTAICVYYTIIGNTASLVVTDNYLETKYSAGQAPADEITTTIASESTRSGVETKQKGHNLESVADRKHLLAVNRVTVANYVSGGKYVANTDIDLSIVTNTTVRVLLSGNGTDFSELASLSIDNDANAYPIEYRETSKGITVQNAITHVMDLYFTGTTFLATYVDSSITQLQTIEERIGSSFGIEGIINGTPTLELEGATANNINDNGNFASGIGNYLGLNANVVINTGIAEVTGDGTNNIAYIRKTTPLMTIGINLAIGIRVRVRNSDCTAIVVSRPYSENIILNPLIDKWYPVVVKDITTSTEFMRIGQQYVDAATANGKVMEIDYIMYIPTDDTIYSTKSATELTNTFTEYFEDYENVVNPTVLMRGTNLVDAESGWEQGNLSGADGSEIGSSNRIRSDFIAIKPDTDYIVSMNSGYTLNRAIIYDSNFDFVKDENSTVDADVRNAYIRVVIREVGDADITPDVAKLTDIQLNEGTTALPYKAFNQATKTFFEIFRSVGTVRDKLLVKFNEWVKELNVDVDSTVVKNATGYVPSAELTNTIRFRLDLTASLDYVDDTVTSVLNDLTFDVDEINFPNNTSNDLLNLDIEGVAVDSNGQFTVRILKSRLGGILGTDFETYLQASTDVVFRFAKKTPVDIPVKVTGSMIQEEVTTISQSQTIPAKLDIVYTVDSKRQIEVNVANINNLLIRMGIQEDSILYNPTNPVLHVASDTYQFRFPLEDFDRVKIFYSIDASNEEIKETMPITYFSGNDNSFLAFNNGSSTVGVFTWFDSTINPSTNDDILIGQPYNGTLVNGAVSTVASEDIYILAIIKVGGYNV